MQKVSLKKLSILGIVLLAASAVTAAISEKSDKKVSNNGLLLGVNDTDDGNTCRGVGSQCTATLSATTAENAIDSTVNGRQTINNTSDGVNQSVTADV
jgi:hypothetical protein